MNYEMKQHDFRCFGGIWGRFVSTDSDQTETAPRKFTLGPLGNLNQVTKGLAKTIRAMADGTLDTWTRSPTGLLATGQTRLVTRDNAGRLLDATRKTACVGDVLSDQ